MKYLKYFESNDNDGDIVKHILSEIGDGEGNSVSYSDFYEFSGKEGYTKPLLVKEYNRTQIAEIVFSEFNEDDMINLGTAIKRLKQHFGEDIKYKLRRNDCKIDLFHENVKQTITKFDFSEIVPFLSVIQYMSHNKHINVEKYDDKLIDFLEENAQEMPNEHMNDELVHDPDEEPGQFFRYMLKSIDGKHELEIGFDYLENDPLFIAVNNNNIDTFQLFNYLKHVVKDK